MQGSTTFLYICRTGEEGLNFVLQIYDLIFERVLVPVCLLVNFPCENGKAINSQWRKSELNCDVIVDWVLHLKFFFNANQGETKLDFHFAPW